MKVGLYGILGVYNFGCEAIVRGAYNFINSVYPGSNIIYFSYSPEYDSKVLSDLNIEIYAIQEKRTFTKRIVNKALKKVNAEHRCLMFDADAIIDKVDIILSIGGDIYTIPKVIREQKKYFYYNTLVDFCSRAIKRDTQVIVYGASVGPWGEYKKAVEYNVKALSKYKAILCREEKTVKYLIGLGIHNAFFFPDPAFLVKGEKNNGDKKYIGVNLSPLSLIEVYGNYHEKHIIEMAYLLDQVYEKNKLCLMFIPHVISKSENDNDLWFMERIRSHMNYKDKVIFADTSNGFVGLKKYISQCRVVIAARMHCAVNAIDEGIPAIFIYYSQKGIGMCKYVYGNENMAVDLQRINIDLLEVIDNTLANWLEITSVIKRRNDEITQYYEKNLNEIKKILVR